MEAYMLDSNETVSLIVDQNIAAGSVSGSIPNKDKCRYVTLDDQETWKRFFVDQNNPSTNTTNKVIVNLMFIRIAMVCIDILLRRPNIMVGKL